MSMALSSSMFTIGRIAYRRQGIIFMHYRLGKGMGMHSAGEVCYLQLLCSTFLLVQSSALIKFAGVMVHGCGNGIT